ncbi:hypothetical protein FHS01_004337 [Longimicrobium terrae]|uniref:Uncharacterized protein n=1 Tax=Longimicrobium terrae TaxID=1639882 RepID=A0A841H734_9BACT|nr:hypothetical protein [Longimicrobium terrae]MBB6073753.1 hypothetical protein [Longimicrobium terrae]
MLMYGCGSTIVGDADSVNFIDQRGMIVGDRGMAALGTDMLVRAADESDQKGCPR